MQKYYGVNELRKMFLDYFASKGHLPAAVIPWCLITIKACC